MKLICLGLLLVFGVVKGLEYSSAEKEHPVYVDDITRNGLVWWEASAVATYHPTSKDIPPSDLAFRYDAVRNHGIGQRITGGWQAEAAQIPHQVNLRMINAWGTVSSCGGSIIHAEWVVTAAHCLANRHTFIIRLGSQNLTQPTLIVEEYITNRFLHPDFSETMGWVQPDDIGLLKLSNRVTFGRTIQPIRLQSSKQMDDDYTDVVLTASGYGLTNDRNLGGESSEALMYVNLRGISNEKCHNWYLIVDPQTVCARFLNNTVQSTCSGDSGGPITRVDEDGQLTQVGIVSFGHRQGCTHGIPTGHVRPGYYHDWIRETTGINFDWDSSAN